MHRVLSRWIIANGMMAALLCCGCAFPTGLLRSRWAMDDPEYASKYAEGASKLDPLGKLKQAADARFLKDAEGHFISGGYAARPGADHGLFGIDIGREDYFLSYGTSRASLMGMSNGSDWFTGVDLGLRIQSPSRLAPFAGVGTFLGAASETVDADDDDEDNDNDGVVDEWGEEEDRISGALASVYPEVGVHFWWTPKIRLTGYGRYMVSTEGRRADDWMLGAGVAWFTNPVK